MNSRQFKFIDEYLIDLNATAAAEKAGYANPAVQGCRLLKNDKVAKAIAARMAERAERVNVDQDYVLATIVETIERCRQVRPVMRNGEPVMVEMENGEMAPAFAFDAASVLKGTEQLGRHLAMFTDKKDVVVRTVSADPMSEDEWATSYGADLATPARTTESLN